MGAAGCLGTRPSTTLPLRAKLPALPPPPGHPPHAPGPARPHPDRSDRLMPQPVHLLASILNPPRVRDGFKMKEISLKIVVESTEINGHRFGGGLCFSTWLDRFVCLMLPNKPRWTAWRCV